MTTCEHCGNPIVAGDRMVAHQDEPPTWNAQGILVSQAEHFTPYHLRCFKAAHPSVDLDPAKFAEFQTTIKIPSIGSEEGD